MCNLQQAFGRRTIIPIITISHYPNQKIHHTNAVRSLVLEEFLAILEFLAVLEFLAILEILAVLEILAIEVVVIVKVGTRHLAWALGGDRGNFVARCDNAGIGIITIHCPKVGDGINV